MIDPRTAPDAITVPYRIDRDAIIQGLRCLDGRDPIALRGAAGRFLFALLFAALCLACLVMSALITAVWLLTDTKAGSFVMSDEFATTMLCLYGSMLWILFWALLALGNRGTFAQQADRLIDTYGALPREGRLTLSRYGTAAETALGVRIWGPPLLRAAYDLPQTFIFVPKLQEIFALPKRGLSSEEIAAVADRVRSGVLGRTD